MGAGPTRDLYPLAVSFLGATGELALMDDDIREMSRSGLRANSATYSAFLCHYAVPGTVLQAEAAAYRLTRSVLLILVNAIHAVVLALSATGSTTASTSSGTTSIAEAPVTCSTSTSSWRWSSLGSGRTCTIATIFSELVLCIASWVLSSEKNKVHKDTITLLDSTSSGATKQDAINMSITNMLANTRGSRYLMASKSNFRYRSSCRGVVVGDHQVQDPAGLLMIPHAFGRSTHMFASRQPASAPPRTLIGVLKKLVEENLKYSGLSEASPDNIRHARH